MRIDKNSKPIRKIASQNRRPPARSEDVHKASQHFQQRKHMKHSREVIVIGTVVFALACILLPLTWLGFLGKEGRNKRANESKNTVPTLKSGEVFENAFGMKFAFVPKGIFWMSENGKNAQKHVKIPHDFYMAVYEVSQGQWQDLMGYNPSYFSRTGGGRTKIENISDATLRKFPVETVSWNDIREFLNRLNSQEKSNGELAYRLPTEAEWEYACRGAATSKEDCSFDFYLAKRSNLLDSNLANFNGKFPLSLDSVGPNFERTTERGFYHGNNLGIYDMHGNVWEWCDDKYNDDLSKVIRGGSWISKAEECSASNRFGFKSEDSYDNLGFRIVAIPSKE